jgi:hypothetical protein
MPFLPQLDMSVTVVWLGPVPQPSSPPWSNTQQSSNDVLNHFGPTSLSPVRVTAGSCA